MRRCAATAVLLVCLASCLGDASERAERPNILVIVTDDQRARGTLAVMPSVRHWFVRGGTWFENAFTTTPLCCPARASLFTGRYVHNHGIRHNYQSGRITRSETVQQRLQEAGYRTAIAGKFLNQWDRDVDPPNFDDWAIFLAGEYYDRQFNIDGEVAELPDYTNDVVRSNALRFIDGFEAKDEQPWFLYVATSAAHAPFTAEPAYAEAEVPRRSFDPSRHERVRSDKPGFLRLRSKRRFLRRDQLRTLMSADDLVGEVMSRLEEAGELDDTLAIFISDNGMQWGEHGFKGKRHAYTDSIRVPLIVRWPGRFDVGVGDPRLAANIDIAPTILEAADLPQRGMDGRSLLSSPARTRLLIEHWTDTATTIPDWAALRSSKWQYTEYYGRSGSVRFREYYDLTSDPFQLENLLADGSASDAARLHRLLAQGRDCKGARCP